VKNAATARAGREPCRVVLAGDSRISEPTLAAIPVRHKRYHFDVWVDGFYDARQIPEEILKLRFKKAELEGVRHIRH